MKELWVEKYRPKTVEGYVFRDDAQRNQVNTWIKDKTIPHLLFSGNAGIGKTTLAKLLINNSKGILSAERQGFEPWQRLHVDRLAICSITTLAPLQKGNTKVIVPHKVNNLFF